MENVERFMLNLIAAIVLSLMGYLILAFAGLTFNPLEWNWVLRLLLGTWSYVIFYRTFTTTFR